MTTVDDGRERPAIRDDPDIPKWAERAIRARAAQATVYLVEPNEDRDLSSGVLVSTASGPVVLTAKHCVADYDAHADRVLVWFAGDGQPEPLVGEWVCHPDLDVALIRPDAGLPAYASRFAVPLSLLEPISRTPDRDRVLLSGTPAAAVVTHDDEFGIVAYHPMIAASELEVTSDGRLAFPWSRTIARDFDTLGARPPESVVARHRAVLGREIELPNPKGMSGGGLWWIAHRPAASDAELWSPDRHLRLIGIQSAWQGAELRIEPIERWRGWFARLTGRVPSR